MHLKPKIEVCMSPALWSLYDSKDKIVVIIDIFRATSTIVTSLYNGAKEVIPTATVPECIEIGANTENSITAGERDGKVAEGLLYGNSPGEYPREFIEGKTLVLTTTNGTKILHMVPPDAYARVIGSFLNIGALSDYLRQQQKDVILSCAAWKDRVNLEDTLFAGGVIDRLKSEFEIYCDSGRIALTLYKEAKKYPSLIEYLKQSTHYHRLSKYGLEKDMEYCTKEDIHPIVPIYVDGKLIPFSHK